MIWEHRVAIIVMLTKIKENNKVMIEDYENTKKHQRKVKRTQAEWCIILDN